jgi:phosphinothricin acetyltransferase
VPALIREAEERDCETVAEIFSHYVLETVSTFEEVPPTPGEWIQKLSSLSEENLPFVVADADGVVVGYSHVTPWKPKPAYRHTGEVTIYVSPEWTGQQIGSRLLADLIDRCSSGSITQLISVIVRSSESSSRALHESFGFVEVGVLRRVGYKHGQWLDTVLMQRSLDA